MGKRDNEDADEIHIWCTVWATRKYLELVIDEDDFILETDQFLRTQSGIWIRCEQLKEIVDAVNDFDTRLALRAEREFSAFNFERADTERLFRHFADAEKECNALLNVGDAGGNRRALALPAYDQALKASHLFNLLDARGVISVTERAAYIGRVRTMTKGCCEALLAGGQGRSA